VEKALKALDKNLGLIFCVFEVNIILQLYCFLEVYSRNNPCSLFYLLMIAAWLFYNVLAFGGLLIIRRSGDEKNNISSKIRQYFGKEDISVSFIFYTCIIILFYSHFCSFMNFGFVFFGNNLQVIMAIIFINLAIACIGAFASVWAFLFFCGWGFRKIFKIYG